MVSVTTDRLRAQDLMAELGREEHLDGWQFATKNAGVLVIAGGQASGQSAQLEAMAEVLRCSGRTVVKPAALPDLVTPDEVPVVLFGKIRDPKTVDLAFEIAREGFLVLTSVTAVSAVSCYSTLTGMGLEDEALALM